MTFWQRICLYLVLIISIFALGFGLGLGVQRSREVAQAHAADKVAIQAQATVDHQVAQAGDSDRRAAEHQTAATTAQAHEAALKRELAVLQAAPSRPLPLPSAPGSEGALVPTLPPSSAAPEAALIIAKQSQALEAADEAQAQLQSELDAKTESEAHLTEALKAETQRADAEHVHALACEATASVWRGGPVFEPAQGSQPARYGAWIQRDLGRATVVAVATQDRVLIGVGMSWGHR